MAEIAERLAALEARVRRAQDHRDICDLKAEYLDAIDGGWGKATHEPTRVAACFTDDAVWEVEQSGKTVGKANILKQMEAVQPVTPFAFHALTNPQLVVNGDTAEGEWHITGYISSAAQLDAGRAKGELIAAAIYKDKFVRTPDGWRIKELLCKVVFFVPFKDGWQDAPGLAR